MSPSMCLIVLFFVLMTFTKKLDPTGSQFNVIVSYLATIAISPIVLILYMLIIYCFF